MHNSIWEPGIQAALEDARARHEGNVRALGGLPAPFPSPADWRDQWIYFILVDRFNNPAAPPRFSWDGIYGSVPGRDAERHSGAVGLPARSWASARCGSRR